MEFSSRAPASRVASIAKVISLRSPNLTVHETDTLHPPSAARPRGELLAAFLVLGLFSGIWMVSLSQIEREYHLTDAALGVLLTFASLVALPLQLVSGRLLRRWESWVFRITCLAYGTALLAIALVHVGIILPLLFPVTLGANVFYVICINAAALRREHLTGERLMPVMQAGFSGGAVVGSLLAGALLSVGASSSWLYSIMAVVLFGAMFRFARITAGQAESADGDGPQAANPARFLNRGLVIVGVLLFAGCFGEATMYSWTTIYLRDSLHTGALVGATGLTLFYATMAVGRLAASVLQRHSKRLGSLAAAGAVIGIGMAIGLATTDPALAIAGVLLTGIGYAVSVPVALSVGGSLAPGQSAAVSGYLNSVLSVAFLIVPVVIGSLSAVTSLRFALCTQLLVGGVLCFGSLVFRRSSYGASLTD
jgi:MFS family permease